MKPGELAQLSVDSLTLEGEGAGLLEGRTVLCRGLFPGERALVRIEALSRHHARAHARPVTLELGRTGRREAPCPNHEARAGRCAGCALMELDETTQRELKRDMLREQFGLEVAHIEPAPAALAYRHSSKRVVFKQRRQLTLGSYAYASHEGAAMPGCLVDHPLLVATFTAVEEAARALAIEPYDERLARGDLRYVWAKTNGTQVIVTLVTASAESRVRELVAPLSRALDTTAPVHGPLAGILHSVQGARGNALRGAAAELLAGEREIAMPLLGRELELGALGFVQPNPHVAELAYRALTSLDEVAERSLAFDLYAGAGITTRLLASSFERVVACELHPESARALGSAAESVESFLARARTGSEVPDLVVANPPRKGLGPAVCAQLSELAAPQLHIMSCGPAGLSRDLAALATRYELRELLAFDTLPQTPHVELVARLRRR